MRILLDNIDILLTSSDLYMCMCMLIDMATLKYWFMISYYGDIMVEVVCCVVCSVSLETLSDQHP